MAVLPLLHLVSKPGCCHERLLGRGRCRRSLGWCLGAGGATPGSRVCVVTPCRSPVASHAHCLRHLCGSLEPSSWKGQRLACCPCLRSVWVSRWDGPTWFLDLRDFRLEVQRRQWHPTPVLLPGKSHGRRSLVGCSPWDR